jgi:hypothetical protein
MGEIPTPSQRADHFVPSGEGNIFVFRYMMKVMIKVFEFDNNSYEYLSTNEVRLFPSMEGSGKEGGKGRGGSISCLQSSSR